jgi:hypothetical protein
VQDVYFIFFEKFGVKIDEGSLLSAVKIGANLGTTPTVYPNIIFATRIGNSFTNIYESSPARELDHKLASVNKITSKIVNRITSNIVN